MNNKIIERSIILITVVLSTAVWAGTYKWVDEKGSTHFSDKPPSGEKAIVIEPEKKAVGQSKRHPLAPEDENALKAAESAFNTKDYSKALALLKPLAEQGNPRAQNGLGMIFDQGLGVAKNLVEAFDLYRKAAVQGYALAQFSLGDMYAKGEGVPKDSTTAASWYRKAAEQGLAFAQHNLALMYASGEGVTQDQAEALRWEQKAAAQGDPNAQYGLGILYAKGEAVSRDSEEAFKWIRKAAEQGYPLHFDFELEWTVGHYAELPDQYAITEFIREGDDINNWRELLTIQNFPPLLGGPSAEDALNILKAVREKECPGVTKWNVIAKDENSILYEWQAKPCRDWPDQHEIARIIHGKHNTFILHYALKTYQMPDEQRTKWIKRFSDAK